MLGLLERTNLNHWTIHLNTETDHVAETSCSLEYRTIDRIQKLSNAECYTPSSEPFRIDMRITVFRDVKSRNLLDLYRSFGGM
jgi:hypothetical protein